MKKETFKKFVSIIYDKSGITLADTKEALVTARIAKRMRVLNLPTHEDYLDFVLSDKSGEEFVNMLDVISTNVTSFFREKHHFVFFKKKIEQWADAGQNRFRIWSAACSSGQEPYTIGMSLHDVFGHRMGSLDVRILATDISTKIIEEAIAGEYAKDKIKGIPPQHLAEYFNASSVNGERVYRVKDIIRKRVLFKRLNLNEPPFPMRGPMDVIFCRNVMIYFDSIVKERLVNAFYDLLKPGGYLFVGSAESLTGLNSRFKVVEPSVYIKE